MVPTPVMGAPQLFSIDVEEHFQVSAFERFLPREQWDAQPSRVEEGMDRLLDLLARRQAKATCFILGWVAERHPGLVRRIAAAGHEIASHGWWHRKVSSLTADEFRSDLRQSKQLLEDLVGRPVHGFRAPSFSIRPGMEWAFDVLLEEGYRYDSSLFPIRRPDYGYPDAPPEPHHIACASGRLLELPMATIAIGRWRLPAAGGGYLRHLPFWVTHRAAAERAKRGLTGMFYIHPWEVDPDQPRLPVGRITGLRHYRGLENTVGRLERLLGEFEFTSVARWLETATGSPPC